MQLPTHRARVALGALQMKRTLLSIPHNLGLRGRSGNPIVGSARSGRGCVETGGREDGVRDARRVSGSNDAGGERDAGRRCPTMMLDAALAGDAGSTRIESD